MSLSRALLLLTLANSSLFAHNWNPLEKVTSPTQEFKYTIEAEPTPKPKTSLFPSSYVVQEPFFQTMFEWKEIEYIFPNDTAKNNAIQDQNYIPGESIPLDVGVDYNFKGLPRIFVTIPRLQVGVPITLGYVARDRKPGLGGPLILPYPDYSWHVNPKECKGMVSVFRIAIDQCDRIWVLDTGKIAGNQFCPRQLLLFNLKTDTLLHRHVFQPNVYRENSVLVTPIADVRDPEGLDTFVYIADVTGYGLIVYDHSLNYSWRIQNKLFYPYPSAGTHRIAGEQFDIMDGVLGMSLGPVSKNNRFLYFHSFAAITENRVPCSLIRNSTAFEIQSQAVPFGFRTYKGSRDTQSAASAIDSNGVMYFGLNEEVSLACWKTSEAYEKPYIQTIIQDENALQFAGGVKVVVNTKERNKEEVWVITNRLQKYFTGTFKNDTVNFRIFVGDTKRLVKGTLCDTFGGLVSAVESSNDSIFFEPVSIVPDQVHYNS